MKKEELNKLIEDPVMLNKAKDGVTFSNDDRQFIKREFDGVISYLKDQLSDNQRYDTPF